MRIIFNKISLITIGLACVFQVLAADTKSGLSEGMVNPGYHEKPAWFKLSFLELKEDVKEATAAGKRVLLYFYQDGCPYCKKLLEDNFGQRSIADKTRKHFDVIAINMWGDREVVGLDGKNTIEKEFAKDMRVMFTPTLVFLDEKGKSVLRINGYYHPAKFETALDFVAGKLEKKMTFSQYYDKVKPVAASGRLHVQPGYLQPPYDLSALQAKSSRPLLVMFEQRHCKSCDDLHLDILKKPETMNAIKSFDVLLLDRTSKAPLVTPTGRKTTAEKWAKKLDIKYSPSLVFFDQKGREVFRTEAFLRTFHIAGAMTYVSSGSYKTQPSFQRYLQGVNEEMTKKGIKVDLMR